MSLASELKLALRAHRTARRHLQQARWLRRPSPALSRLLDLALIESHAVETELARLLSHAIDEDARQYAGPWPVVAHPPCARWCRLAGLVEARWGHRRGEDGGCFASALANVRRVGGVLEHPAYSDAWARYDLPKPPRHGGWVRGLCGGWSTHVEQGRYGHPAKKATWLYAFGAAELPEMLWGSNPDQRSKALVSWCGNHVSSGETRPRVGKKVASATTPPVRRAAPRHRRELRHA